MCSLARSRAAKGLLLKTLYLKKDWPLMYLVGSNCEHDWSFAYLAFFLSYPKASGHILGCQPAVKVSPANSSGRK